MNRWKRAAILCAILAAMGTPVFSGLDRNTVNAETAAIRVNNHFPANMAAGVSPDTPLTVEFAGAVNQSFYQTVNLNLFNGTDPIDGEMFYNPSARQIMFKAKQPLKQGQTYTAQLSYYDGLGRTSEKVWSFQTDGGDQFRPMPATQQTSAEPAQPTNPENHLNIANASMGSGKVSSDTPLEVTFTEPLDIVSLKSAPVKLFENNQPIGIDYKLSRDLKTLTVSPRNGLKADAAYAIAVERSLAATTGLRLHKKTLIPFRLASGNDQPMVAQHEIEETPAPKAAYDNPFADRAPARQPERRVQKQAPAPQAAPTPSAAPVQLVGLSPINGARVTNLTQPVTIGFSEEIRPETLNEFTFRLEDDFGPVPAKIHYFKGHKQATLTPVGLLDSNKNYRIVVTQGITDQAGRPIRSGINSMFSTTSPVSAPAMPEMMAANQPAPEQEIAELESFDRQPRPQQRQMQRPMTQSQPQVAQARPTRAPARAMQTMSAPAPADRSVRTMVQDKPAALNPFKVTAIFPGADHQKVSRKSKIAVHFSEPADPRTVDNINISVFGNQTRVEGKVVYDRRKNRAIFEPSSPLDANTEYKVIVSDKIKSRMGEPLTSQFSWQFATAAELRHKYNPRRTAEADAAFYIPLVDSKLKREPGHHAANIKMGSNNTGSAFNFVSPKHWSFKSVRHITNKGILNSFPFVYTDNVTRYEFATAINSALSNLKTMQHMASRPKLKIADMVELQQLIVEFRSELRSCAVNTAWFESFLQKQGVNMQQIEARVRKLNQS